MQLHFEKKDLLRVLLKVQGVSSARNTLPILANVLIEATDNEITFSASNLEIGVKMKADGEIVEPGQITLSAKKFADIVKQLPDETVQVTTTANDRVEIVCGDGTYKIIGANIDDFPTILSPTEDCTEVDGQMFVDVINKTEYAASTQEIRYTLNAILLKKNEDNTEVVATDGTKQLSLTHCPKLNIEVEKIIIPLNSAKEIARIFEDAETLKISYDSNQIIIANDTITIATRVIEGEYPPYTKLFRDGSEGKTVVSRTNLLNTCKRVSLLSDTKTNLLKFNIDAEHILVSAESTDHGNAYENVKFESSTGEVEIGLDAIVITQVLSKIQSENVVLEFNDNVTPLIVKPDDIAEDHTCFIMPMRLQA